MTRKTDNVAELADLMIEVHRKCTMGNADFCASLISCAVSIAGRDGLSDERVLKHVMESATSALSVVRANQHLEAGGGSGLTPEAIAQVKLEQNIVKWKHAVRTFPADDPRHVVAKQALAEHARSQH